MSCDPDSSKVKNQAETTTPVTEEVSDLDWDDEDFELEEIVLTKTATANLASDKWKTCENDKDEDDWSVPTTASPALPEEEKKRSSYAANTKPEPSTDRGELYLTKQFRSLHTPASKKKPRCAICTRPLKEEHWSAHLCSQCFPGDCSRKGKTVRFDLTTSVSHSGS